MKHNITNMADLTQKIKELEAVEAMQIAGIKLQKQEILEGLRPSALIKNAFNEITSSKEIQHNAIDTSLGIGAGLLARKLFTLNSKNIFRKMTGFALQFITTSLVAKKMPVIRGKISEL